MRFFTLVAMQALFNLEVIRMEFLLLPSMTVRTLVLQLAPILVACYKMLGMPILTHFFRIVENRGLSSVILPVVSIDTDIPFMVILSIRAPHCLEVEDIKVHIWFKLLYQLHRELALRMSKRAKLPILTVLEIP
jgi:hypothetical protein